MATSANINELIETIKESRNINSNLAYAFATGMLGAEVSDEIVQDMINSLRKAN